MLWLIGFVLIDSNLPWPSGWALLPVLGTALIILAEQGRTRLMGNPLAQWLGNISYSLYLWHWPLVVALYFAGLQQQGLWILGGLALSLLLGQLSLKLVENPVRRGLAAASMGKQIMLFMVTGAIIGAAAVGVRLFSFEGRLPKAVEIAAAETNNRDPRKDECQPRDNKSPGCIYGKSEAAVILLGDSHAESIISALGLAASAYESGALYLGKSGCTFIEGLNVRRNNCSEYTQWVLQEKMAGVIDSASPVLLISRVSRYLFGHNEDTSPEPIAYFDEPLTTLGDPRFLQEFQKKYIELACKIEETNPTYIMRPIPEIGVHVPNTLARNYMFGRSNDDIKITLNEYHKRHAFTWAMQDEAAEKCGVKILDPLPYLCDDQYCYGSRNGRPLYYDDDHLSEYGNKYLIPMFEQVFLDIQNQPAP